VIGKNNLLKKQQKQGTRVETYSIKKFTVGIASVAIGSILFLGSNAQASDKVEENKTEVATTVNNAQPATAEIPTNKVEENKQQREEEAKRAEPIIHEAIDEVLEKFSYLSVRPMMALLTDKADRIRRRELHRALAKLPDISDKERRIIDSMSRMIVRKMLREPMIHFNEIAGTQEEGLYWDLFKDMFNLEKEGS